MTNKKTILPSRLHDKDVPGNINAPGEWPVLNQEHGEVMRAIGHSNSSEEFGSQEHSVVMDAILGRGND